MSEKPTEARDWSASLNLPETAFPMRAGLPQKEPEILQRWADIGLYGKLRQVAKDRPKFVLHDGPPYANGNIHIGHALNKILKDVVTRSQQMLGHDSNYVPGWDCHGLPIEWKIEEQYRAKGKNKDAVETVEFRQECRRFAEHWISVQMAEFKRLGVEGDWAKPYLTMTYPAEAQIAREIMKFARYGQLYRGSKPVMWSVVEKTALAEAEVEYEDHTSDTVWVKFGVKGGALAGTSVVIWTTTPWTLPGNRAISYSHKINYGLYEVTAAPENNWAKVGDRLILADKLAEDVMKAAKVESFARSADVAAADLKDALCAHPLADLGYGFDVPLLDGDHVSDDTGTGFVHTAPGHGREDFDIWTSAHVQHDLNARGINTAIPYTVDADGFLTAQAPGFEGRRVITDKGDKGDANEAVIKALVERGALIARSRLKHQYPHSWRSKKPVIFRNTPQWFIHMDRDIDGQGDTLRTRALAAIKATRWVPGSGENRINGMIESRPDWVVSRQRAWGVPIAVFIREKGDGSSEILHDEAVDKAIADAFMVEGADAWYKPGAAERFLGARASEGWQKVDDILDVWFDSGSTHAFVLEDPVEFPGLAGIHRKVDGGTDTVMYLEGSDQHRGWFHSSLLESCGTRGRAPYDVVLTHGFCLDENGRKMSKSLGNVVAPQEVIKDSGADILRLWVAMSDYSDDLRIGKEILKTTVDTYRKLRNTLRWMLGNLVHFDAARDTVAFADMPELERLMLHRLAEMEPAIRKAYADFDYKKVVQLLAPFMTVDLSAFYFDIRKDTLYCEPISSTARRACLTVLDQVNRCVTLWLAPFLCFTAEEAWLARYPSEDGSVHLETFPEVPAGWRDDALADKWKRIRQVRRVVTGALEIERAAKRLGSSLEAAPVVHVTDAALAEAVAGIDMAEVCITSGCTVLTAPAPADAFLMAEIPGVAVVSAKAEGSKCARSWRITDDVGADPEYPDLSARDALAVRERLAAGLPV